MINFLLLTGASTVFARVMLNKVDIKNKIIIAFVIGISLTTLLTFIQITIDFIFNLILSLF